MWLLRIARLAGSGRENRSLPGRPAGHHSKAGCSERWTMAPPEHSRGSPARKGAVLLALGNTCIFYVAPLIVAHLVGRLAGHGPAGTGAVMPYVLGFAGVLLFA